MKRNKIAQYENVEFIRDSLRRIFEAGMQVPDEINNIPDDDPAKLAMVQDWAAQVYNDNAPGKDVLDQILNYATENREFMENTVEMQTQMQGLTGEASRVFNFSKSSQIDPELFQPDIGVADTPNVMPDPNIELEPIIYEMLSQPFQKGSDLDAFLSSHDRIPVQRVLETLVSSAEEGAFLDAIKEALESYYTEQNPSERERIAGEILQAGLLPHALISPESQEGTMTTEYKQYGEPESIEAFVSDINDKLEKIAKKDASVPIKKYNLSKQAQHKTSNDIVMYGPSQVRVDPFSRMPASEWSIIERNKGFGLVVDDVWNLDWETLWRGNVMDKYSRPYRDKDGNWIGGYINKRFEVDRWQPEENNYQLKPGEKRKPRMPEYGLIEGRLEAMRSKPEYAKSHGPASSGQPFNWKEAQTISEDDKETVVVSKKKS